MTSETSPITLLIEASKQDSFETFADHMAQAMLFPEKRDNRRFAMDKAIKTGLPDGLFIELGVAAGNGCRLFGKMLRGTDKIVTGFDSFEGLQEDWTGVQSGRTAGSFNQDGVFPKVPDNVTLVKGWVQDTLPGYLKQTGTAPFSFIHMDMDTYTPTLFA
mgnify:CR=1 FL=1